MYLGASILDILSEYRRCDACKVPYQNPGRGCKFGVFDGSFRRSGLSVGCACRSEAWGPARAYHFLLLHRSHVCYKHPFLKSACDQPQLALDRPLHHLVLQPPRNCPIQLSHVTRSPTSASRTLRSNIPSTHHLLDDFLLHPASQSLSSVYSHRPRAVCFATTFPLRSPSKIPQPGAKALSRRPSLSPRSSPPPFGRVVFFLRYTTQPPFIYLTATFRPRSSSVGPCIRYCGL